MKSTIQVSKKRAYACESHRALLGVRSGQEVTVIATGKNGRRSVVVTLVKAPITVARLADNLSPRTPIVFIEASRVLQLGAKAGDVVDVKVGNVGAGELVADAPQERAELGTSIVGDIRLTLTQLPEVFTVVDALGNRALSGYDRVQLATALRGMVNKGELLRVEAGKLPKFRMARGK